MKFYLNDNIINNIKNIQALHPNVYLGGSASLILQNAIPNRLISDIDLIVTSKINIQTILPESFKFRNILVVEGIKYEFFKNENAQYLLVNNLKLSPIDEIFEWKLNKSQKEKHNIDYEYYKTTTTTISRNNSIK